MPKASSRSRRRHPIGLNLQVDRTYVVFASVVEKRLFTNRCMRMSEMTGREDELSILRALRDGRTQRLGLWAVSENDCSLNPQLQSEEMALPDPPKLPGVLCCHSRVRRSDDAVRLTGNARHELSVSSALPASRMGSMRTISGRSFGGTL